MASAKGVSINWQVQGSLYAPDLKVLPMLIGDVRRFQQVLINLVKNALKFTKQGRIEIEASYSDPLSSIIVLVRDSGVGIDSKDFKKLFTRFGKLHRTSEMNSEGIGLGLTIVKNIVEKGGGKIQA